MSENAEDRALDALGMLAFLSLRRKDWTEEEIRAFARDEGSMARLTEDEVKGTGSFSFESVWARVAKGEEPPSSVARGSSPVSEELVAMHRGEPDISPEAKAELERQRREALGDEDEDVDEGVEGEDTGDGRPSPGDTDGV